ncbi:hypothetical protein HN51_061940, partial [Arachis hypogaea]
MTVALNRSAVHSKRRRRGALLYARCSTTPPLPVSAPRTGSSSRNSSPSPASTSSPVSPSPLHK